MTVAFLPEQRTRPPARYRCFRALVRLWSRLALGHIRILQAERAAFDGPTILVVNHPARWLDALILIAAFDEAITVFVDRTLLESWSSRALAWAFEVVAFDAGAETRDLRRAERFLRGREIVALFTDRAPSGSGQCLAGVADLAVDAESERSGEMGVAIIPIHILAPHRARSEALIYVGEPLFAEDYLATRDEPRAAATFRLRSALESAIRANPFSLQPDSVEHFLAELEELMREDLAEDWAARPNWKQTLEGFELSGFVKSWCERLNRTDPARLVELRQALIVYRRTRQHWSLRELQGDYGGALASSLRHLAIWTESAAGFPVALYGLINHLPAGLVLWAAGLFNRQDRRSEAEKWFLRAAIVLACYAGEIALASQWLGRSGTGYYAVTLPLSGAYLARYIWLWRRRTRFLLRDFDVPYDARGLRRMRKRLIARFDAARNADASPSAVVATPPVEGGDTSGYSGTRPGLDQGFEIETQ